MPGMMRRAYQTDLSDAEWALIEPHLPAPRAPGRPRVHPLREILDAIFYVVRGGCTWRLLPHDLERRGRPSTITSESGASTAPGSGCTRHCAGGRGCASGGPPAQRWHHRQPEREDHRGGRRRAWLRSGQEGEGKKAPPFGGHAGTGAKSEGPRGERLRPRRDKAAYGARRGPVPTPFTSVARCRLQRQG